MEIRPGRTERQQRAGALHREFTSHRESVLANKSLSVAGKSALIGKKYLDTKSALAKLHNDEVAEPTARRAELHNKLFGLPKGSDPGSIIAYRDARDRADRLTNQAEAIKLADSALQSGDEQLLTAVIEKSLSSVWKPIVEVAASKATAFPKSEELAELLKYEPAFVDDTRSRDIFERSQAFTISKPPELASFADDEKVAAMVESLGEIVQASQKSALDEVVDRQAAENSQ